MSFKIGDVCVGHSFVFWPENNGAECVILSSLDTRMSQDQRDPHGIVYEKAGYFVRWDRGEEVFVPAERLRLKRPPSNDEFTPAEEDFTQWLKSVRKVSV